MLSGRDARAEGIRIRNSQLYVIQNGRLGAEPEIIERSLKSIVEHSVATVMKSNARGDLYRMYLRAQRSNVGFNYVVMPDGDVPVSKEPFSQAEMTRLFELGVRMGSSGTAWKTVPPGAGLRR